MPLFDSTMDRAETAQRGETRTDVCTDCGKRRTRYPGVLGQLEEVSASFYRTFSQSGVDTGDTGYRRALLNQLSSLTSRYRSRGEGRWTDQGRELCRRATDIMKHDV